MFSPKSIVFSCFCLQVVLSLIAAQANQAEATVCAPLSRFKIDCNTCYCSVDGRRYTCTKKFCSSNVALNYNDFMADEPHSEERVYFDDTSDDWMKYLNDLAASNDQPEIKNKNNNNIMKLDENEYNENNIDYGDYLKEQTEYIGSPRRGYRF